LNLPQLNLFRFFRILLISGILLIIWSIFAPGCMTMRKSDATWKTYFNKKNIDVTYQSVAVRGHRLHFVKTGQDTLPTIVFIHGSPGSWDAFQRYLSDKDLLQKYRLIAIDRPGFGYSDFGKALHLQEQTSVIGAFLRTIINGKPLYITGHSLGGPLALQLCAEQSALISGAVILAGSTDPAEEKPEKWRPVLFSTPLNLLVPGALRPSNEELWYLKKDLLLLANDFPKISCPVYLVHGKKDMLVPFENAAYSKKMLSNSRCVSELYFPEENHFIPWTQFEAIKQLLLSLTP
jgi:pimeloyl-ACP methyl ester carboxylesterase